MKMSVLLQDYSTFMSRALELAAEAAAKGEVPVGALLVFENKIIAEGRNQVEELNDASLHAEAVALRAASKARGRWRLTDCTLFSTLEPCVMCAGFARLSRVSEVVFGAPDLRFGGAGSVTDLFQISQLGPAIKVSGGVMEAEAKRLLQDFFAARRKSS